MNTGRMLQNLAKTFAILAPLFFAAPLTGAAAASEPTATATAPRLGPVTGMPLPRYAALKDDKVNMRHGPGRVYPIKWVLTRRHMPVRIIGEHGAWRRVQLVDGDRGWIYRPLLARARHALAARGAGELYVAPAATAQLAARVDAHTPIKLLSCAVDWCRGEVGGERGWVPKQNLWGVRPGDVFD